MSPAQTSPDLKLGWLGGAVLVVLVAMAAGLGETVYARTARMPPIWLFDGIAVGPSGAIYVSAHGIHRYVVHG